MIDKEHQPETWKPIPEYEGHYEASSLGRVRSVKRNHVKILKPKIMSNGNKDYLVACLWLDGKQKTFLVHRLIAFTFIANSDPLRRTTVNHKDTICQNNCAANLEWVTHTENVRHAIGMGCCKYSKLSLEIATTIRELHRTTNLGYRKLAKIFDVNRKTIHDIIKNVIWKTVEVQS